MNNLDKILDAINAEADEKLNAIRQKNDVDCAEVKAESESRIEQLRAENAEKLSREREMILTRAKSSAEMRHREIMLGARAGLLDKAYTDAEKYIYEMDRTSYGDFLARLLSDALCERAAEERALAECGEETEAVVFTVCLNKADRDELGEQIILKALDLVKSRGEAIPEVILCDVPAEIKGGLILRGGDVEINCTVKALIDSARARTEAEAARVLFS